MMRYEYLLFDADDTLFDYSKAEVFALTNSLEHHGIVCNEQIMNAYRTINQQLWSELELGNISTNTLRTKRFERLIDDHGLQIKSDIHDLSQSYLERLGEASFVIEGALDICRYLLSEGIKLAIITNGIKEVQLSRINRSELADLFEDIIISEDTGFQKPHQGIFDYTFKKLNIKDKKRVMIIGDSLSSDIKGGINYGIDTCWFNPHYKKNTSGIQPTYEINSLEDLMKLI